MTSDEALMPEFHAGSRAAFEELFARYHKALYGFFGRRLNNTARTEDLTQETFFALIRAVSRYEPRASVRTEGKNGFVCVVERAWIDALESPELWNPKNRGPPCYNAPAARTVPPITLMRTKCVLAGQSKDEIHDSMKAAVENKELPHLEPDAMTFMLSKQGRLNE